MGEKIVKPWVHWLLPGSYPEFNALFESNLASIRMRAGLVGQNASALGLSFSAGDVVPTQAQTIVIGKIGDDCGQGRAVSWLKQIKKAKLAELKVILDYTDHHLEFPNTNMGEFYSNVLKYVSRNVVPSKKMKEYLSQYTSRDISIVAEPIEFPIDFNKKARTRKIPTVVWFGHGSNIEYLMDYLNNSDTYMLHKLMAIRKGIELYKKVIFLDWDCLQLKIIDQKFYSLLNERDLQIQMPLYIYPPNYCDILFTNWKTNQLPRRYSYNFVTSSKCANR